MSTIPADDTDNFAILLNRLTLVKNLAFWLIGGAFSVGIWVASLEWRQRTGDEHIIQIKTEASIEKLRNDMQESRLYDAATKSAVMQNDLTYIRNGVEELKAAQRTKP